jgi:ParB family transcriptional regulator, chromosome partitioning protein
MNPLHQSLTNESYTPAAIIEAARAVMGGIDLDPATCEIANLTVRADWWMDLEADG